MMGMKSLFVYEEQDTFSVSELNDFNCALLAYFDHGFLVQKRNLPMFNAWQQEAKAAYQKNHKLPIILLDSKVVLEGHYPSVKELEEITGVPLASLHTHCDGECCDETSCDLPRHRH